MRVLLLPIVPLMLGAPTQPPARPLADMPVVNPLEQPGGCPETPMSLARKKAEKPELVPLDKLPDAMTFAAVDRRIDGCPAPLVLSRQPAER